MPTGRAASEQSSRDLQIIDPVLTQIARSYRPHGFLYNILAPSIDVGLDSGQYPIFDAYSFFGDDIDNKVSDRAPTPEVDFSWSTDTYLCEDYRLKATITRKERRQAHSALRLEQNKLETVLNRMALRRERRLAAVLQATGAGGQLTGGTAGVSNKWNVDAGTIESDITTGLLAVYNKTGVSLNTIVLDYPVAVAMSQQQDIRDLLRYTVDGRDIIRLGEAILPAEMWGLRVVIAKGTLYNAAREGTATTTLSSIWDDTVRMLYVNPDAGWGIPSVAYSFKAEPEAVDRWKDNDPPVDNVRAWECIDEKVCAPELGYTITDVL